MLQSDRQQSSKNNDPNDPITSDDLGKILKRLITDQEITGSAGSYTPCHYDTYSCNLVTQVYGRKTWLLFPHDDIKYLQPTRIPYEESSVYSKINFASEKSIQKNIHGLQKCSPLKVTLEPGDCLYVPYQWWHFVKSDEFSISVNTWIELPEDHETRLQEAVLRSVVASLSSVTFPDTTKKLLNPNEASSLPEMNETDINDMLQLSSSAYMAKISPLPSSSASSSCSVNSNCEPQISKRVRTSDDTPPVKITIDDLISRSSFAGKAPSYRFEENVIANDVKEDESDEDNTDCSIPPYLDHLINAIGHPVVLRQVTSQFLNNISSKKEKLHYKTFSLYNLLNA